MVLFYSDDLDDTYPDEDMKTSNKSNNVYNWIMILFVFILFGIAIYILWVSYKRNYNMENLSLSI